MPSKVIKEFKEFAMKGNMIELAIGVIIGGAFSKVVTSIVNDIVMPPVGLLLGRVNFTDLFISLNGTYYENLAQAKAAGAPTFKAIKPTAEKARREARSKETDEGMSRVSFGYSSACCTL